MTLPVAEHRSQASLYVHVPFCAHKCEYCAFYSEAGNAGMMDRYTDALVRELEMLTETGFSRPRTIFFGGGTPSLLSLGQWNRIFDAMDRLSLSGALEWTVECNPATVSLEKARLFRQRGVNRISMGVQSFNEALLERLGRVHTREMAFRSFDTLRRAGFDNINVDLMFAIPGQSMEIWRETLSEGFALQSEHLSSYEVIYEEDTPLYEQLKAGQFDVDEELACAMYDELIDATTANGLEQYEVANFARGGGRGEFPSYACRHNVNYWRGGDCVAAGPSACGYVGGRRTRNWANTQLYCEFVERGSSPIESSETLPPLARAGELAAFGLRVRPGWPFAEFNALTGFDLRTEWKEEMARLISLGYGEVSEDRFRLTRTGLRYADWAAELFLRLPEPSVS